MIQWWEAMSLLEQIMAVVGILSTLTLVIQIILNLIGVIGDGIGGDAGGGGLDADIDFDVEFDVGDMSAPDMDFDTGQYTSSYSPDFEDVSYSPAEAPTGLSIFTVQGIISFLAIFSWSGLLMIKSGVNVTLSIFIAAVLGFIAMVCLAAIMRGMLKLQHDGTMDIRNALGKSGSVYLTIPSKRHHAGKVSIIVQGEYKEIDAITDDEDNIQTGSQVLVTGISGKNTLLVKRK